VDRTAVGGVDGESHMPTLNNILKTKNSMTFVSPSSSLCFFLKKIHLTHRSSQ
jgi:hypothetical protein